MVFLIIGSVCIFIVSLFLLYKFFFSIKIHPLNIGPRKSDYGVAVINFDPLICCNSVFVINLPDKPVSHTFICFNKALFCKNYIIMGPKYYDLKVLAKNIGFKSEKSLPVSIAK